MDEDVDLYEGREHSKIKHLFLSDYLKAASFKVLVGATAAKTFTYVDGFAGPWSVSDESDCSDSSFDHAVKVLLDTKAALRAAGRQLPKLRFLLCERDPEAFKRLSAYAAKKSGIEIRVFHGDFEDNLDEIRAACEGFTFSFIDPKGWNLRSAEIADFLASVRGDFLLNFMEHPISRHNSYPPVRASFARFLDDADWDKKIRSEPGAVPREAQILDLLKARLKARKAAAFMPDFAILKPRKERVQMRLVLGTHHIQGVEVFRTVEKNIQAVQSETRQNLASSGDDALLLFSPSALRDHELSDIGVGGRRARRAAKELVVQIVAEARGFLLFELLAARVMEQVAVRITDVKDIAMELRAAGSIHFDLVPPARKPKENTVVRPSAH